MFYKKTLVLLLFFIYSSSYSMQCLKDKHQEYCRVIYQSFESSHENFLWAYIPFSASCIAGLFISEEIVKHYEKNNKTPDKIYKSAKFLRDFKVMKKRFYIAGALSIVGIYSYTKKFAYLTI